MCPQILVASPSKYRQEWYRSELDTYGLEAFAVENGIECIDTLRTMPPDALILESSVRWGGADGVLVAMNEDPQLRQIPVVIIAVDGVSVEEYRLARFSIQGFFNRVPSAEDLASALFHAIRNVHECAMDSMTTPKKLRAVPRKQGQYGDQFR